MPARDTSCGSAARATRAAEHVDEHKVTELRGFLNRTSVTPPCEVRNTTLQQPVTPMSRAPWPPPRDQLPRAEARPKPGLRLGRVLVPLALLGGYVFVSLSLKSHVLQEEPAAADVSARRLALPGFKVASFERSVGKALAAAASLEATDGGGGEAEETAAGTGLKGGAEPRHPHRLAHMLHHVRRGRASQSSSDRAPSVPPPAPPTTAVAAAGAVRLDADGVAMVGGARSAGVGADVIPSFGLAENESSSSVAQLVRPRVTWGGSSRGAGLEPRSSRRSLSVAPQRTGLASWFRALQAPGGATLSGQAAEPRQGPFGCCGVAVRPDRGR